MDGTFIKTLIRGFQLFCTLIVTALIGNVIASNVSAAGSATAAINFSMFVAVICWLAAIYGLVCTLTGVMSSVAKPIIILSLDGVATLFTFIDAVVLAAKLKAVNCADLDPKNLGDDYIAFGSLDDTKRCREIQASTAFLWFLFATFIGSLFFSFGDFKGRGVGGSVHSSRPSMAQVRV
jgi:hypothetical protein